MLVAALHSTTASAMESVPKAVIADPPPDAKFPARMEVIHVPSGGVQINGVVYVASGERPHPAFVELAQIAVKPGREAAFDAARKSVSLHQDYPSQVILPSAPPRA
jgi:hypothetical protein